MLAELRKHSKSVIIYVLFAIIIVVFVFTFNMGRASKNKLPGTGHTGKVTEVLVDVGSTPIDVMALEMGLRLTMDPPQPGRAPDMESIRQQYFYMSTRFPEFRGDPKFASFVQDPRKVSMIKSRKVVDDLVETYLVSEEARKNGLFASPDEIRDRILERFTDPSSGEFRRKTYENWVRYRLRASIGRFEDFIGREIEREKMIALVTAGVVVPEREARWMAAGRKNVRSYEFLEVSPSLLSSAIVSAQAEVDSWLSANEDKAKKYFEEHRDEFASEAGVDFHVLKYSDEAKANAAVESLKGKTGSELQKAMEALAVSESEDEVLKKTSGRPMTALTDEAVAGLYGQEVAAALASAKEFELSPVIRGQGAFFLVMLDGRRPKTDPDYDRSRDVIARRMLGEEKVGAEMAVLTARALDMLKNGQGRAMEEIAAELNASYAPHSPVRSAETGDVRALPADLNGMLQYQPDVVPGIGSGAALVADLAVLTPEAPVLDKVLKPESGTGSYVVRLKSARQNEEPTAEEIAAASAELSLFKRLMAWREWYASLKATAAASGSLTEKELLSKMISDEERAREEAMNKTAGTKAESPVSDNQ